GPAGIPCGERDWNYRPDGAVLQPELAADRNTFGAGSCDGRDVPLFAPRVRCYGRDVVRGQRLSRDGNGCLGHTTLGLYVSARRNISTSCACAPSYSWRNSPTRTKSCREWNATVSGL